MSTPEVNINLKIDASALIGIGVVVYLAAKAGTNKALNKHRV